MMQIQVRASDGEILGAGQFPTPPDDPTIELYELADAEVPKLTQPGRKRRMANGTVEVTPPPPPEPTEAELNPLDYGTAVPTRPQLMAGVDTMQGYINNPSPNNADSISVVKVLCRAFLFLARRLGL